MASKLTTKKKQPKKMVSLFAGIGGFELAFKKAGVQTVLMCEIDPVAKSILKENIPDVKLVDDVCKLKSIPRGTDILCAGFPCQDLSSIGIKKGMSGTRSSLVREVFRLLEQTPVEWVIFENVSYMLRLNKGEAIRTIVDELEFLGYRWAYRTIDSMAFVPQHRPRVFVVASLHNNPNDVLLSDSVDSAPGDVRSDAFDEPCGFYWTEGKYALGLYQNGIPTLKCGSTIGIASPPAIAFPDGTIGCPDIRDGEKFQGFPADWTKPAEKVAKPSARWKLVGNAVTVDTVAWIAGKMLHPKEYDGSGDRSFKGDKWPSAAWGVGGKRFASPATRYPVSRDEVSLFDFLEHPCKPLSLKAATGFEQRLNVGTVRCPAYFKTAIRNYVKSKTDGI